jgi:sulfite exporter TauE/SafE
MWLSILIAGLTLGFAGSLHCVGMCGPLMVLLPSGKRWNDTVKTQLIYHFGRVLTYILLGALAGLIFIWVDIRIYKQQFSLALGFVFLGMWLYEFFTNKTARTSSLNKWVNRAFGKALAKHKYGGWFLGGMLNGLLPCGLVYGALLTSVGTGSNEGSIIFMLGFGLATSPALIALSLSKSILLKRISISVRKVLPFWLLIMAIIFFLRGANLGIPFLSPKFHSSVNTHSCCH